MTLLCQLFFSNDTATTEIYTLSLHDALPISACLLVHVIAQLVGKDEPDGAGQRLQQRLRQDWIGFERSEEHTSELQSRRDLVCRLLLEKKKTPVWLLAGERRVLVIDVTRLKT